MEMMESRIANLENLRKAGIVVLSIKDSQKDIFSKEYRQALTAINHIVQESKLEVNRHTRKQKNGWIAPCEDPCADTVAYQDIALHRTHTMVSFIGSRGTGKTSAMLTVLRQLQSLQCSKDLGASFQPPASTSFICLEPIDAGILQSGEDIIAIVLARMFNYLQQSTNGNNLHARYQEELRGLYREFDKLYQNLCRLRKGSGHFLEGESALRELQNLASSHSTAREFKNLVSHLLTYIKTLNGCEKDQYLVVALDDIDMYGEDTSQNCYTLLEEIFDYLSFPGIIVLTTYNENLLKRNCSNHLRRKFFEGKKNIDCDSTERTEVKKLVQQFLEKLIIEEYRVYMPILARVDVSNQTGMSVRLDKTKESELYAMFNDCTKQGNEIIVPVKTFLLRIIAERTNVYFDSRGQKRHFFEPYNLRDLSVFWRILDALEGLTGKDDADREKAYANNRSKLFNYTMNPFASEKLEERESEYLSKLSQQPLERQEQELIDEIKRRCNSQENSKEQRVFLEGRWQHNYGELLHCLYYATRLQKDGMSKGLIYCILSSYSLVLNQLYYSPDFKAYGESRKTFSRFVGSSVAGTWANEMLPKIRSNEKILNVPAFYSMGSAIGPASVYFDWKIDANVVYELFCIASNRGPLETVKRFQQAKEFIQAFQLLGMLFTNIPGEGLKLEIKWVSSKTEKQDTFRLMANQDQEICFNALNFSVNSLELQKYFENSTKELIAMIKKSIMTLGNAIHDDISNLNFLKDENNQYILKGNNAKNLEKCMGIYQEIFNLDRQTVLEELHQPNYKDIIQKDIDKISKEVEKRIHSWSLQKEFEAWDQKGAIPLPLQNFDMMYNIIKRLANTNYYGHSFPEIVYENEAFESFKQLYMSIGLQLKNQDAFYNGGDTNVHAAFETTYKEYPFYKYFVENPSPQLKKMFAEIVTTIIRNHINAGPAQFPDIRISDLRI